MTTKRKLSLTKVIQLSRTAMDEGNKIQAIKIIRDYTNLGLLDAKKLVETYDDGTPCRTLAARWECSSKETISYSCDQCNEQMLPGSQPIVIGGRGLCSECADAEVERLDAVAHVRPTLTKAPTLTPTVKDMTAKLKAARAPQVAPTVALKNVTKALTSRPMDHMSFDEFVVRLKAAGFVNTEQWLKEHKGAE